MGDEFGQPQEWNFDESLSWHFLEDKDHSGLSQTVAELNTLLREEPALHQIDFDGQGFEWIDCQNWNESIISFLIKGVAQNYTLAIVYNFTPVPRRDYRVGVPLADYYTEVFNSDAAHLGGTRAPRNTQEAASGCVSATHKTAQHHAQDPHKSFTQDFPHNLRPRLFHKTSAQGFPTTYRTRPGKSWWHKASRCATNVFFFY